mmetsp:Transcript_5895/g.36536  ORF Transcript_5895/g.36536 Transcript_5895/m.36536 type:complete len:107 (+) Transcript_5895:3022-3342(+)
MGNSMRVVDPSPLPPPRFLLDQPCHPQETRPYKDEPFQFFIDKQSWFCQLQTRFASSPSNWCTSNGSFDPSVGQGEWNGMEEHLEQRWMGSKEMTRKSFTVQCQWW